MNGYKAFYSGRETDIHADTRFAAWEAAVKFFNPPKSKHHMVHVHLCELAGKQVVQVPSY
jgi:hypothetical protein